MNTFEQDMKAAYEKLEKDMDYIASLFPGAWKKGYMGENIMLLDFAKKDFNEAIETTKKFEEINDRGWNKNNRIAFTF